MKNNEEIKFNKIYWLNNFETWKNFTFPENKISSDTLKSYNENWYNIYETVNTFIEKKRQIKDLAEIKSCFIDIDYPEIIKLTVAERATFMKDKYKNLTILFNQIKEKYNIEPNVINITYKWFHILFYYSEDCYFIDSNLHLQINNILNETLWWDENARDIARVYKSIWFIDWKGWKKGTIKNYFKQDLSFITKDKIIYNFWLKFIEREKISCNKKQLSQEKKEIVKNSNIEKINNIDALCFLEKLQQHITKYSSLYNITDIENLKKINNKLKYDKITLKFYEEDWQTLTAWLIMEQDQTLLWKINDYSKKTRRGNYNFLKNWILKDLNLDYSTFSKILQWISWFTLNSSLDKKSQLGSKLLWDDHYWRLIIWTQLLSKENQTAYKNYQNKYTEISWLKKVYRWLFVYLYEYKDYLKQYNIEWLNQIRFEMNHFLETMFWKKTKDQMKAHRIYIKELFFQISSLMIPIENITIDKNWKQIKQVWTNQLVKFYFEQWNGRWKKEMIWIELLLPDYIYFWKASYINKNVLNYQPWFWDTKITDFFIEVDDILSNTNNDYTKPLSAIFDFLLYSWDEKNKKSIFLRHLNKAIELNFFKSYKIENNTLTISNKSKHNLIS